MAKIQRGTSRRNFLKAVGIGALGTLVSGGLGSRLLVPVSGVTAATTTLGLVATDGYITMPGREDNPIYIFGFRPVSLSLTVAQLEATYKGHTQHTAPTLGLTKKTTSKLP